MNHIFGPVPSRRLGLSLGIDIIPQKTCTLDCIYCQIGKTNFHTSERKEYVPVSIIKEQLSKVLEKGVRPDWVTISGSGEPTLNSSIGNIIKEIKLLTNIPVCIITNGTLLWDAGVRKEISSADMVMPSLDSAVESTFSRICRITPGISVEKIISGLEEFRKEYSGKIWLEIMMVSGINDTKDELEALKNAITKINPDSIQLNTVVRPPSEIYAAPLTPEKLQKIKEYFGDKAEIVASFKSNQNIKRNNPKEDIIEYLKRRPATLEDISVSLGYDRNEILMILSELVITKIIRERKHIGKTYWEYNLLSEQE